MKYNQRISTFRGFAILFVATVFAVASFAMPMVQADKFDEKIEDLAEQNSSHMTDVNALELEAANLQDAINKLEAQINGLRAQIAKNQAKSDKLKKQIAAAELELAKQKELLGANIKAMYLEGEISTLEMLATSKDLSQFVDKQQYREVVRSKIKDQVDKITELRLKLKSQRDQVERLIKEDQNLKAQVSANKAEQDRLLGMNQGEQQRFNEEIKSNNKQIQELRRQQFLENVRLFGGGDGVIGGGGYPWGNAKCLATGKVGGWCPGYEWGYNGSYHNWATGGYAFRNCTDWVAYRVRLDTGHAPSGLGNANTWDDRAPAYGYRVSSTPRKGAAAVSNAGFYGHVMYVEEVNSDGSIVVSDYNRAGTGKYDMNQISPSGLRFVYF